MKAKPYDHVELYRTIKTNYISPVSSMPISAINTYIQKRQNELERFAKEKSAMSSGDTLTQKQFIASVKFGMDVSAAEQRKRGTVV
jgi:hypothetical protein